MFSIQNIWFDDMLIQYSFFLIHLVDFLKILNFELSYLNDHFQCRVLFFECWLLSFKIIKYDIGFLHSIFDLNIFVSIILKWHVDNLTDNGHVRLIKWVKSCSQNSSITIYCFKYVKKLHIGSIDVFIKLSIFWLISIIVSHFTQDSFLKVNLSMLSF